MTSNAPIVTRFAPSPTGYLHIGSARTALLNWLYARGRGGKFLLRIEDTDRARHNEAAAEAILDGLSWLGLDWDGEPTSQYARRDRHAEAAADLLAAGKAYRCYMSPEETEAARDAARASGARIQSPWRDKAPSDAPADTPFVVRFKAPEAGETRIADAVQGDVIISNTQLDDLVLLRSDGTPTYMLAVVVDDHDMGVTHIIRGDDHLTNAARQAQIYEAFGWKTPQFAHIALIHGEDGAKLSKRHGALGVEAYRDMGYLPWALNNYLLRLGWSHGDDEVISKENALKWFDLDGVGKAPSRLDLTKLSNLNAAYLRDLSPEAVVEAATPFLNELYGDLSEEKRGRIARAAAFLQDRSSTLKDFADGAGFLVADRPLVIEGKAAKPLKKEGARERLKDILAIVENIKDWTPDSLDAALQTYADEQQVGFGQIGPPVRASLTGGAPSPGLGEIMAALGKEETIGRLRDRAENGQTT